MTVKAGHVSEQEALQKAEAFMHGKSFKKRSLRRALSGTRPDNAYYVFNVENNGGFVIVSGSDATPAILGYAESGELDLNHLPDNLRVWLEDYAAQLSAVEVGEASPMLRRGDAVNRPAIDPLIQTQWNQNTPYSLMIPTYKDDKGNEQHYVTGCVATALAQVMYYYQWPKSCPSLSAYNTYNLNIHLSELPATTFDWELMQQKYNDNDVSDAAQAVAKLMRYIGQSIKMDYNKYSSSASIDMNVMIETFGYTKNMYDLSRSNYTTAEWESLIYQELSAGRPVLYSGSSENGGHQFICDGYDGDGLFHINWGWGGSSDGYFVISLANPDEKGIGGGMGTGGYAYRQRAIVGFQPATDNEQEIPLLQSVTSNMPVAFYTRSSTDVDFVDVSTDGCRLYGIYNYVPTTTFPIEAGWAIWQNNELLKVVASNDVIIDNRDLSLGWYTYYSGPGTVSFGAGLQDGKYRLVQVWRQQGSTDEWKIISTNNAIYAVISGNNLSVRGENSANVEYAVNHVSYSGEMCEGTQNTVTITLTNNCDATQQPVYFWMKDNGTWQLMGKGIGSADPDQTDIVNLTFNASIAGDVDVRITSDSDGVNEMWKSTVRIYEVIEVVVDGVKYALNTGSKEAKVTGTTLSASDLSLTILSSVAYNNIVYSVTRIGYGAFKNTDLVSIGLPTTLQIIDEWSFFNCYKLKEAVIPEGVKTIGANAFAYCFGLVKVSLPSTLTSIGSSAFYGNSRLSVVVSNMSEPVTISPDVFTDYTWQGDEIIEFFSNATLYVPIGKKPVYQQADVWKQFSTIFEGELKESVIDGITYRYATGESFTDIIAADAGMFYQKELVIPGSTTIDGKVYNVRKIEDSAFKQVYMTSLIIEPGLEEIGDYCFWNCNGLKEVIIPEGVRIIGESAFSYCYSLKEVSLPSTLTSIGSSAFYGNSRLSVVVSNMSEPVTISPDVFTDYTWQGDETIESFTNATLYVPIGMKPVYQLAEVWKQFKEILEIDDDNFISANITVLGGGTIVCNGVSIANTNISINIKENDDISLQVIPDNSYRLASLMVNGNDVTDDVTDGVYTIKNVTSDVEIYASFERYFDVGNLTKAVNFIMNGNASASDVVFYDLNHNEKLDIGDVILIVKSILNNSKNAASFVSRRAGEVSDLSQYTAAQFELRTAGNINVEDIRLVKSMKQTHQLMCQQKDANTYAVVVYSMSNQLMQPENGKIIEIGNNSDILSIENVTVATPTGETAYYHTISVTTGIEQTERENGTAVIYDLKGNRLNESKALENGIYIINGKKVLVR